MKDKIKLITEGEQMDKLKLKIKNKELLIICNNVLSKTNNNGKTIYSFINSIPFQRVHQLYFSEEKPKIEGIDYFQLSDSNIIKGIISHKKRGRKLGDKDIQIVNNPLIDKKIEIRKNIFTMIIREFLWWNKWKSKHLISWLDAYNPTTILFVGGDCLFAYSICKYITKKYHCETSLYITDDYFLSNSYSIVDRLRKLIIKKKIKECAHYASNFFTISEKMKEDYIKHIGIESFIVRNMTTSLLEKNIQVKQDQIILIYTGSLYYGRDDILSYVSKAISSINKKKNNKKIVLKVYTNNQPKKNVLNKFEKTDECVYCGHLDELSLKLELNKANILLFIESFDEKHIEKTKYSFSTKITEYMSLKKPIFAIGPSNISSMMYLKDISISINDLKKIENDLYKLASDLNKQEFYGNLAYSKYNNMRDETMSNQEFLMRLFNIGGK